MPVSSIGSAMQLDILKDLGEIHSQGAAPASGAVKGAGFSEALEKSLAEVNAMLIESDKKSVDMATGKSENLHDAMITFEKAETAFKLMMQVRNKAIEAYHEIMRMQV